MQCVSYIRVSTQRQHESGLGEDAQRAAVERYIGANRDRRLLKEFVETESGKNNERPVIHEAIAYCKAHKARLIIAKLDRLARSVKFIVDLMESEVKFTALDLPEANNLTIHIMAAMAQHEAEIISKRTRDALARSKKQKGGRRYLLNKKTGKPTKKLWDLTSVRHLAIAARKRNAAERNAPLIKTAKALRHDGNTLAEIGAELKKLGHLPRDGGEWHPAQVQRLVGKRPKKA
jgi:DNA invertase Pin-like site-specific DNA recombinase